jgi:hypothetical protein
VGTGPGPGCGSCGGDVVGVGLGVQKGGRHGSVGRTNGGGVVVVGVAGPGVIVVGVVVGVGVTVTVDGGWSTRVRCTHV